ncbi:hypothetical protein JCM9279_007688 [Rhodotorula babjevae]
MYGAATASDDSEDEGCYVYWDTPSILPPAPQSAPSPGPRRPSQRSGAPSPSFGTLAVAGTPKPKRTTTAAALPSPSGSTSGAKATRALRQRKRLKGARRSAAEASSQPLDARALQMVSQLALKVNARTASMASQAPPVSRARQASIGPEAAQGGKGKGRAVEQEPGVKREPLRPSPTSNASAPALSTSTSTTPLRRTPARAARAAQPALSLSATKTSAVHASPRPRKAAAVPTTAAPPPPRPALGKTLSSATVTTADEFDSFFDDGDDTFELALSQLDERAIVPTPPSSAGPPPAPALVPAARAPHARVVKPVPAHSTSRAPPIQRAPPPVRVAAVAAPAPARTAARPPPPPAPKPAARAPAPALFLRTSRASQGSAQKALVELAQREADALAADLDLGAGGWSDEDF